MVSCYHHYDFATTGEWVEEISYAHYRRVGGRNFYAHIQYTSDKISIP